MVDQGRHAIVRTDLQEVIGKLVTTSDVALDHVVFQSTLFELDGDFLAVRGWPVVQVEHEDSSIIRLFWAQTVCHRLGTMRNEWRF